MVETSYDVGELVVLRASTRVGAQPTDAATVSITVRDPAGTETTATFPDVIPGDGLTVVRDAVGEYHRDFVPLMPGVHTVQVVATGQPASVQEWTFSVARSRLGAGVFEAPWVPMAAEVREEMPGREAALARYGDIKIDALLAQRGESLAAELPSPLPSRLHPVARLYLIYSVASILEDRLFPEQSSLDGSNAERLDRRAGAELLRLRAQVDTDAVSGDSAGWSGTLSLRGGR